MSEQSLYNLAARTVELEVIPACREFGLGVIPWSPLAGGMLGGSLSEGEKSRRRSVNPRFEKVRPQLEAWEQLCSELGEEPAAVALAWLLHQDGVTAPILDRARSNSSKARRCGLRTWRSTPMRSTALDEIFPGPGGTAPEAYAW